MGAAGYNRVEGRLDIVLRLCTVKKAMSKSDLDARDRKNRMLWGKPTKLYTLEGRPPSAFVRPVVGESLGTLLILYRIVGGIGALREVLKGNSSYFS